VETIAIGTFSQSSLIKRQFDQKANLKGLASMSNLKFLVGLCAFLAGTCIAVDVEAQRPMRPALQFERWLGHGCSVGYHWRNPGPDISYYCPFSDRNSNLVSGYPNIGCAGFGSADEPWPLIDSRPAIGDGTNKTAPSQMPTLTDKPAKNENGDGKDNSFLDPSRNDSPDEPPFQVPKVPTPDKSGGTNLEVDFDAPSLLQQDGK